jgi:sugar phosphate isomerase/epimerase
MPRLAAFPKAFIDQLCIDGSMRLIEWIDLAASLDIDGLEFYAGFLDLRRKADWPQARAHAENAGLEIPMLCCSPDFTHPDPAFRAEEVKKEKGWIEMTAELGGGFCRVLSGQRRPEVSRQQGIDYAVECIEACLPLAEKLGVTLVIENHYKDNYWQYPEFGVNYDPSNTILAGEDPLVLLDRVKDRVVSMHASDRYLAEGTIEDLRREEDSVGYAKRLRHGEIGKGMNDYDKIFGALAGVGFDGWISIEDGVDGMEQLRGSVAFLRKKMKQHWPDSASA